MLPASPVKLARPFRSCTGESVGPVPTRRHGAAGPVWSPLRTAGAPSVAVSAVPRCVGVLPGVRLALSAAVSCRLTSTEGNGDDPPGKQERCYCRSCCGRAVACSDSFYRRFRSVLKNVEEQIKENSILTEIWKVFASKRGRL